MVRFRVETMPSVTVPVRPSGDPIAMAVSPTRSESGSVPTSLAVRTRPSLVRTSSAALAVAPSRVTTWVFVRIFPLSSRMMPEPVPPELPLEALIVTTLGVAFSAAAVMALTSSLLLTMTVSGWVLPTAEELPSSKRLPEPTVATPPPTRPAARMLATRVPTPKLALRLGASAGLGA
jgi:hypothetical protein